MKRVKGRLTSIFSLLLILAGIVGISAAVGWGNELQPSGAEKEEHISFALYGDMKNQQIAEEVAAVFQKQNQCRVDIYCYCRRKFFRCVYCQPGTAFVACR